MARIHEQLFRMGEAYELGAVDVLMFSGRLLVENPVIEDLITKVLVKDGAAIKLTVQIPRSKALVARIEGTPDITDLNMLRVEAIKWLS